MILFYITHFCGKYFFKNEFQFFFPYPKGEHPAAMQHGNAASLLSTSIIYNNVLVKNSIYIRFGMCVILYMIGVALVQYFISFLSYPSIVMVKYQTTKLITIPKTTIISRTSLLTTTTKTTTTMR